MPYSRESEFKPCNIFTILRAIASGGDAYIAIRNSGERITSGPEGLGFLCNWRWHSGLKTPALLWHNLSSHILQAALRHAPVVMRAEPSWSDARPLVSFIIGHRGVDRLPQLTATLRSIAGQVMVPCECIVVEQDVVPRAQAHLPAWVNYVHTPVPSDEAPFSRSWAFNVGAKLAQAEVVVLHDGDILIPQGYSASILNRIKDGYDVVNAKRFVFYLSRESSRWVADGRCGLEDCAVDYIMQNADAGGSVAMLRSVFREVGGMDEGFSGWGCEDNELWERLMLKRVWNWGYLPLFHLWHDDQPTRDSPDNPNWERFCELQGIAPAERAVWLAGREFWQGSEWRSQGDGDTLRQDLCTSVTEASSKIRPSAKPHE
jgi:hypothetical protein